MLRVSDEHTTGDRVNGQLILPYALPYLLYVGVSAVPARVMSTEWTYGLRILLSGLALAWAWRAYVPLRGPRSPAASVGWGAGAGILGLGLWVLLIMPFSPDAAEAWCLDGFLLRVMASGLLVPLFEELLLRGLLLGILVQWQEARRSGVPHPIETTLGHRSIGDLEPGQWTWVAVLVSTAAFAIGHPPAQWAASAAYGLLMCVLWILRRDLLSCVVAHAVTNVLLAAAVWRFDLWYLW